MKTKINHIILLIYAIIVLIILSLVCTSSIFESLLLVFLVTLITFILKFLEKKYSLINKLLSNKLAIIILIILAIILRISLIKFNHGPFYSDEATFYYNATNIVNKSPLANRYIALFPYLYSYIALLSIAMKIFGTTAKTIVILNILIDLIGALFAYLFGKSFYSDKRSGVLLLLLWLFNPFQIIWCFKALPINIVNTMFIISIYLFNKLTNKRKIKDIIIYSIILGLILGISNMFRPIFIIFIIAIFVYYIYKMIFDKEKALKLLASFILITICFSSINKLYNLSVSNKTNIPVATSSSGWCLYVGSNISSNGSWFEEPKLTTMINDPDMFSPQEIHQYFKDLAINNYKSYDILTILRLYKNKLHILVGDVDKYSYSQFTDTITNSNAIINIIIKTFTYSYYFFMLIGNIFVIYKIKTKKIFENLIFLIILELGLIASHLLVEVSPRYFLPLTVPMIIILSYSLITLINIKEEAK